MEVKRDTSEFNDALGYTSHLTRLFMEANLHQQNLNMHGWSNTLWSLFTALSSWTKPEEKQQFLRAQNIIKHKIFMYSKSRIGKTASNIPEDIYDDLQEYTMKLYDVYKAAGLMTKNPDDPLNALR
jgi:hypothetical protein